MNFDYGYGMSGGLGAFSMLLWWVLIIFGIVALVKWTLRETSLRSRDERSALDLLKERYARGEIETDEFEEKKKRLA